MDNRDYPLLVARSQYSMKGLVPNKLEKKRTRNLSKTSQDLAKVKKIETQFSAKRASFLSVKYHACLNGAYLDPKTPRRTTELSRLPHITF